MKANLAPVPAGLRLAYGAIPEKTYKTRENALAAFYKTCAKLGLTEMAFIVANDMDRFFVITLPTQDQCQNAIWLAHNGIMTIRT